MDDQRDKLARDMQTLATDARTAYRNIALDGALLKNVRQSYALTQARYKIGLASIVDLMEAQLQATQSEIDLADARYTYLSLLAQIDYDTGHGS